MAGQRKKTSAALARLVHPFWANDRLAAVGRVTGARAVYRFVQGKLFPPQALPISIRGEPFQFWFRQADEPYDAGGDDDTITPIHRTLKPGHVVLDVGANHGFVTLFCARRVGPTGLVVSFEPDAGHVEYLRHNIEINGITNARVVPAAVGATPGRALFHHDRVGAAKGVEIEVTTLDAAAQAHGLTRIDLIKIDVEGFELDVLRGAEAVLKMRPTILVEIHPEILRGRGIDPTEPLEFLRARGYSTHLVDGSTPAFDLVEPPPTWGPPVEIFATPK